MTKKLLLLLTTLLLTGAQGWTQEPSGYWVNEDDNKNYEIEWYMKNTAADDFTITSAAELAGLAYLVNNGTQTFAGKTINLEPAGDAEFIDLSAHYWVPIGGNASSSYAKNFQGFFDGKEKTIKGLYIGTEESRATETAVGLFGQIYATNGNTTAGIKDLTLSGGAIWGDCQQAGALVGSIIVRTDLEKTTAEITIEKCVNNGVNIDVLVPGTTNNIKVGGLIGYISCGFRNTDTLPENAVTLLNCSNNGTVSGTISSEGKTNVYVGGVAGFIINNSGGSISTITISGCTNSGEVKGAGYTGGILGDTSSLFTIISNCTNSGKITHEGNQNAYIGGISGRLLWTTRISGCVNSGNIIVEGELLYANAGGITGSVDNITKIDFSDCSNSGAVTGGGTLNSYTGGLIGNVRGGNFTVSGSSNSGTITGGTEATNTCTGGLMGYAYSSSKNTYSDLYNSGPVISEKGYTGGLAGMLYTYGGLILSDSYATGSVQGGTGEEDYTGGLAGAMAMYTTTPPVVSNCLAVMDVLEGAEGQVHRIAGRIAEGTEVASFTDITDKTTIASFFGTTGNYAIAAEGNWDAGAQVQDGADLNVTPSSDLSSLLEWSSDYWDFPSKALPQLKAVEGSGVEQHPSLSFPLWAYQQPDVYHALTLEVAPGIDIYGLTPGTLSIEDGSHLHLQFLPEDRSLSADAVMLVVDGEETTFSDLGGDTYFSYILNPIDQDHTILIALREYNITLPHIEGAVMTPGPGEWPVAYGQAFRFSLTGEIDPALIHVYADGQEIQPDALRTVTLTYTIERVTGPISVTIEGIATANTLLTQGVQLRITNYELQIENTTGQAVDVAVYTLTGKTIVQHRALRGSRTITLPAGTYIVRAGNIVQKVILND